MKKITTKQADKLIKLINDEDLWDRKPTCGSLTEMDDMDLALFVGEVAEGDEHPIIPEFTEEEVWGRELEKDDSICQQDFMNAYLPELFVVETLHFGILLVLPEGFSYARYIVEIKG